MAKAKRKTGGTTSKKTTRTRKPAKSAKVAKAAKKAAPRRKASRARPSGGGALGLAANLSN